jgi:hypothetical protein
LPAFAAEKARRSNSPREHVERLERLGSRNRRYLGEQQLDRRKAAGSNTPDEEPTMDIEPMKATQPTEQKADGQTTGRNGMGAKERKAGGRPERYTVEIAAEICQRLANGETLTRICQDPHLPSRSTVTRWLADESKAEFLARYGTARDLQTDFYADDIVDIADDASRDWTERTNGEGEAIAPALNHEHIQRSKVRIETRQWIMERLNPKKYSAKTKLEHGVGDSIAFAKLWQMVGSGDSTAE